MTSGFPVEVLSNEGFHYADVTQLANNVETTNLESVQSTDRIKVIIRYKSLPESLIVEWKSRQYVVTEINQGTFNNTFITLFADRIAGAV